MTGAEQTTVNELAGLVRGIDVRVAGIDDRIAAIESGLRRLEDDKVARDAVTAAHSEDQKTLDLRIGMIVGVVTTLAVAAANIVAKLVFGL